MTHMAMAATWVPFLRPLNLHSQSAALWVMAPLVLGICIFYKALKVQEMRELPVAAAVLSGKVLAAMAGAGVALWILATFVLD
jgi:hypothetical protein